MTTTAAPDTRPTHVSQLATTAEVAALLKLDPYTVRAYARDGILPAYRVGRTFRFDLAVIRAWLDARLAHPSSQADQLQLDDAPPPPAAKPRPVRVAK
jgi:excisionase family DNA binding protein